MSGDLGFRSDEPDSVPSLTEQDKGVIMSVGWWAIHSVTQQLLLSPGYFRLCGGEGQAGVRKKDTVYSLLRFLLGSADLESYSSSVTD